MAHVNPAPIALPRRLLAEAIGTGLLVTVVVGSGIAAQRLSPGDTGLQLLEYPNIVAVLVGRVDPDVRAGVRGAVQPRRHRRRLAARPSDRGIGGVHVAPYIGAQTVGAVAGALLANAMFDLPLVEISGTDRAGTGHGIGESVATAGLVALIFLLARTGRHALSAAAVGAYIGAAYWFTSSTSFANPAVTVGRVFTDTFAGITPSSVPLYVGAQIIGAAIDVGLVVTLFPDTNRSAHPDPAVPGNDPSEAAAQTSSNREL